MYNKLIPSVEKRLATWVEIQTKSEAREGAKTTEPASITISREFGCEGYPLAKALKVKFELNTHKEWTIFDDALINRILNDNELSQHILKRFGDNTQFVNNVLSMITPTPFGRTVASEASRSMWRKIASALAGDFRLILVSVITSIVTAIVTVIIIKALGW